ncbi:MAG: hypothetical protein CNLJKLNK_01238 [Holosporales bacterium]
MTRNIFYLYPFLFLIIEKGNATDSSLVSQSVAVSSTQSQERAHSPNKFLIDMANRCSPLLYDDLRAFVEKISMLCQPDEGAKFFFITFIDDLRKNKTIDQQRFLLQYICALMTPEQTSSERINVINSLLTLYDEISDKNIFNKLFDFLKIGQNSQRSHVIDWQTNESKMRAAFFSQRKQLWILQRFKRVQHVNVELCLNDLLSFVCDPLFFKTSFLLTCEQLLNLFIKKNSKHLIMTSKTFFQVLNKLIGMQQVGDAFEYIEAALLFLSSGGGNTDFYLRKIDEISNITFSASPAFAAYVCALAQIREIDYDKFKRLIEDLESPSRSNENLSLSFCDTLIKNRYAFNLNEYLLKFNVDLSHPAPVFGVLPQNPLSARPQIRSVGNIQPAGRPQIKSSGLRAGNGLYFSSVAGNLQNFNQSSSFSSLQGAQTTTVVLPVVSIQNEEGTSNMFRLFAEIPLENISQAPRIHAHIINDIVVEFKEYFEKKDAKRMSCCFCFLKNEQIVEKFIKRSFYLMKNKESIPLFKEAIKDFLKTHGQ